MPQSTIRSRIDSATKQEAQILLKKFGLSMSDAIRLFLHQVVLEKGLPFEIKLPEDAAQEHDLWFRSQIEAALEEADSPATTFVAHGEISSRWAKKRQSLSTGAAQAKKS